MSGAIAYGEQNPTLGETAVSWQTWSDGAAGIPDVVGDADWGKLSLPLLSGSEGRSAVKDLGSIFTRKFTLTENRYGTGTSSAVLQIRGETGTFAQDDITPAWETYTAPISKTWRYVQIREYTGTVWTVGTAVSLVDARVAPYVGIGPGDTIELASGTHHPLEFKNIIGESGHPITIINSGGLVEFTDTAHQYTFTFKNCQFFRLSGTGDGAIEHGIKVTNFNTMAVLATCKSRDMELDHIEINECTAATGIGIHVQSHGLPAAYVNAYNTDAFDYNGDSTLDADDELDGRYWTMENLKVHDCKFDGGASHNLDVPIYIGYSNYTETPHLRDLYDAENNLDEDVTVYYPPTDNVEVYDNTFAHTTMKCVQVGACLSDLLIHDNTFTDVCSQVAEHDPAIGINPGSSGVKIYNNIMIDMNNGYGIYSYGEQVEIYNNVIIDPGYYGMIVQGLKPAGYHHYLSTWVMNNTIVSTYNAHCIGYANSEGSDDRVQNNILINSNAFMFITGTLDASTNNYTDTDVDDAKFTDHDNNDYTLAADSPCLNAGVDLSAYGVTDDIIGTSRPQGAAYDEGAYERV